MTKNRRAKQDARRLVESSGMSYIQALREVQLCAMAHSIPTPFPTLNGYLGGGWKPGQLITVAAQPGIGHTAFIFNAAVSALNAQKSVLYSTTKMSTTDVLGGITALFENASPVALRDSHLTIDADQKRTIESIRTRAISLSQSVSKLDLIIIDGLEFLGIGHEAKEKSVRQIKALAQELEITVLLCSEIGSNRRNDILSIDPSALTTSSDVVILLADDAVEKGILEINLEKNRAGESQRTVFCLLNDYILELRELDQGITVWELGEYGGYWFVEGTLDERLARYALRKWLFETDPEHVDEHQKLSFAPRDDWYWEPIFADYPEGESELRSVEKHGPSEGKSLMRGIFIQA